MPLLAAAMLQGDQLLAKLDQLRGLNRSDLVRACGYATHTEAGREHLHFTDFYEAILEAKGVHLPGQGARWRARRNAQGRQLSFNTHVHFNGNLMVGRAYTEKLQLQPGDQFRIQLSDGEIRLIPLEQRREQAVAEAAAAC
ncbi:AbrB family transcriptional regulator [Synechococcus sp. LA31]|uniref:AbrB family transcriptional regulator n=1 Tax=Synechococcus sp. LA31 TaxID=2741953 RepID=UPI00353009E4